MIDISTWAEVTLRDAGFETWQVESSTVTVFENPAIIGFLHVFESSKSLLAEWEERQNSVLRRHAVGLRAAGEKAWNVYSVFLTPDNAPQSQRAIEQLEEDFRLTRKIARSSIGTKADVEFALLALVAIKAHPLLDEVDLGARLISRLEEIPVMAVSAFLAEAEPNDVAQILGEHR